MRYFVPLFMALALSSFLFLILLSDAGAVHHAGILGLCHYLRQQESASR